MVGREGWLANRSRSAFPKLPASARLRASYGGQPPAEVGGALSKKCP